MNRLESWIWNFSAGIAAALVWEHVLKPKPPAATAPATTTAVTRRKRRTART